MGIMRAKAMMWRKVEIGKLKREQMRAQMMTLSDLMRINGVRNPFSAQISKYSRVSCWYILSIALFGKSQLRTS